ncbi:MAG TPA: pyridoxine 5'-phosphate synthase [Longimicrobiales bacterium]|nr:pyridoxine 5'-phosphate synthase [Longimicrobiales bacterium]
MRFYVNVDHVATVRQARGTDEPDPVRAAVLVEMAGAHGITVHLREDRRHIQDRDVRLLTDTVRTGVNLEMATDPGILELARELRPMQATLVPEKREEVTTEGGLDLSGSVRDGVGRTLEGLKKAGIRTSLFIDPDEEALKASRELGVHAVELHTGEYADAPDDDARARQLRRLRDAARAGRELGLAVHAGHGLTYENVVPVAAIPEIEELNIGHSVVSRAVFVGLEAAVREMGELIRRAPSLVPEPGEWIPPAGF